MFLIGSVLGGYVFASVLFLRNPHLLPAFVRKRKNWAKPERQAIVHISHRGGAGESYENTVTAFKKAVALGTHMLELDVHLTKDHIVVVSHDDNTSRIAGIGTKIIETNFADLPLLRTQIPVDFVHGISFSSDKDASIEESRKMPSLESVFQKFPGIPINVDIKPHNLQLIQAVSELVARYGREDITIWGNFRDNTTKQCFETNGNIGILFSFTAVLKLLVLFYTGLLPYVTFHETHLEIPMPSSLKHKLGKDLTVAKRIMLEVADWLLMRKSLFEHLKKRGVQTYLWVLNNEDEFDRAFKQLGVTGVMTDYPTKLQEYLRNNPEFDRPPIG